MYFDHLLFGFFDYKYESRFFPFLFWVSQGILAAQLTALQALAEEGVADVGLLYVVSEETDHSGMLKANDLGLAPDFLVVGEPTGSKMM